MCSIIQGDQISFTMSESQALVSEHLVVLKLNINYIFSLSSNHQSSNAYKIDHSCQNQEPANHKIDTQCQQTNTKRYTSLVLQIKLLKFEAQKNFKPIKIYK